MYKLITAGSILSRHTLLTRNGDLASLLLKFIHLNSKENLTITN